MTVLSRSASLFAALLLASCAASAADKPDLDRIADHFHKAYSTPPSLALKVKDLKPSPVPGYLSGKLEITAGKRTQVQDITVSKDGRWYFLGGVFEFKKSPVPGLKGIERAPGAPPHPPVQITKDGRHMIYGEPKDVNVDPDLDNLSKISLKGVPVSGPADAPILIVKYSELQCPHCQRSHEVFKKEFSAYKGKYRSVFKHYPLKTTHPWSYPAALAATCVEKLAPNKAEEFRGAVFSAQKEITADNIREKAAGFAEKAGLKRSAFLSCLDNKETKARVDADIAEGDRLGFGGVPTVYVNGRRARGYQAAEIKAIIDEMLPKN